MPEKYTPDDLKNAFIALQNKEPAEQKEKQEKQIEIISTFTLPDQTKELDFKDFASPNNLFGSYYMSGDRYERFKNQIRGAFEPFNGVKGRTFHEAEIPKGGGRTIKEKLDIKPISFNEWLYLFSKLTLEQAYGVNYYVVQLDNGREVSIKSELTKSGGGPYGYSLDLANISGNEYSAHPLNNGQIDYFQPHIIFPAAEEGRSEE